MKRKPHKKVAAKAKATKAKKPARHVIKKVKRLMTEARYKHALMRIVDLEPAASPGMSSIQGANLEAAQDIAREALGDS